MPKPAVHAPLPSRLSPSDMSSTFTQGGTFGAASLYVGDLDPSVSEAHIFDVFSQIGPVTSIRVCRDLIRKVSLGYAYVNFHNPQDATRAREVLNFTTIKGKPIRIMFKQRDPSSRKSGVGNIFVKNLDKTIDNKLLYDIFVTFGTVLSCKVATGIDGQTKGFGFVQFEHEESAHRAIRELHGMLINEKPVHVGYFIRRQQRNQTNGSPKFTNVYIKNLPESYTDDELKSFFEVCGKITSGVIMKDANGNSKGFGFVNFEKPEYASAAVDKFNGVSLLDKVLYVGKAQKKTEREAELKAKYDQERKGRLEKLKGLSLYLKNIDDSINDEKLRELFSPFGSITACKVILDSQGQSKGSGFVAFSSLNEANQAINEMNGKMIGRKLLYVAVFERKEERRAKFQTQFAQSNASGPLAPAIANMPGYHSVQPRVPSQQLYYGQGYPGFIPSQFAGYGFHDRFVPSMRPGVSPNYMLPYNPQSQEQHGHRASRRGGLSLLMQQQVPMGSSVMPMPLDTSGMHVAPMDSSWPSAVPSATLASALASASPERQRVILGEHLFPLVEEIEREQSGKVTGMLLEMDQPEVLHLIESPDALQRKVAEALQVLRSAHASAPDAGNHLDAFP